MTRLAPLHAGPGPDPVYVGSADALFNHDLDSFGNAPIFRMLLIWGRRACSEMRSIVQDVGYTATEKRVQYSNTRNSLVVSQANGGQEVLPRVIK